MTAVIGELDLRKKGATHWTHLSPIEFQLDSGKVVICEKGFTLDFGSIPRLFWSITPPIGTIADLAWDIHDRIYWGHRENGETNFTRLEADNAMLELHHHLGTSELVAHGSWTAVRGGGQLSWMNPAERWAWRNEGMPDDAFDLAAWTS